MLSGGRATTGKGSALIRAAAAAHPEGYCTARMWLPTPQARSGSTAINAAHPTAADAAMGTRRRLTVTGAAAAART